METNELDGKIARKIMGWHIDDEGFWRDVAGQPKMSTGDVENNPELRYTDWPTWSPSGDSEESWRQFGMVLRQAMAVNPYLSLCLETGLDGKSYLGIVTTGSGYKQVTVEQWGDGPLEAACRAILEAWGDGH